MLNERLTLATLETHYRVFMKAVVLPVKGLVGSGFSVEFYCERPVIWELPALQLFELKKMFY